MFCDVLGYWFEWDKVELVRIIVVNEVFILWRERGKTVETLGDMQFIHWVLDDLEYIVILQVYFFHLKWTSL